MLMISIFVFVAIIYFILMFIFIYGEIRTEIHSSDSISNSTKVSVIVAVRNEETNILKLIQSIQKQKYSKNLFEVIFVNDHSTDKTHSIIENNLAENFKLLHLRENEFGKKQAIKNAISEATGEIIVTIDGDCSMQENWLQSIVSFYEIQHSDMIIAPVMFEKRKSFLGIFQFYDFLALISSTLGACGVKKPIMCNGANLIYKKQIYNELINPTNENTASGDDMFLMINLKKQNKKIDFLNSNEALVTTKSETNFVSFINQRIRWAGKNTKHNDFDIYLVGIIVYLFNLSILIFGILSISNVENFIYFFQILVVKTFIEFLLLSIPANIYKQKISLTSFFIIQPFHNIYTVLIPILSIIFPYKWKERKI